MSEGATARPRARDPRLVAISLVIILLLSGLNSVWSSFQIGAALAKLAIGLAHLAAIGWGTARLLELKSPRHLAVASHLLLGQVVALGYVYLRSAISSWIPGLGISVPEIMLVEGALLWFAWRRSPEPKALRWRPSREHLPGFCVLVFWLSWLLVIAFQKLDLYNTPSSDPDIHAFYTKLLIERGHLFYDLMPASDASMVYPSGFSCLSFVLGLFTGLHPVQLVNIGPYLQFTLFCGAGFAVMSQSVRRPGVVVLGLVHFGLAYLCFNAVFAPAREMLEGTPRLAHGAILFFPLFFVIQQREALRRRPSLLALPLCGVVTGMCINPAHAPAALLFGAAALVVLFAERETRSAIMGRGAAGLARSVALLAAIFVVFLSTDPFYRSLFLQQSAPAGMVEPAQDLTGDALSLDLEPAQLAVSIRQAVPRVPASLLANPGGAGATHGVQILLLAGLLSCFAVVRFAKGSRGRGFTEVAGGSLTLAGAGFACLVIHALWLEVVRVLVKPEVLQGSLLLRYTEALQYQISVLFFALGFTAFLACFLVALADVSWSQDGSFAKRFGVRLLAIVAGVSCLVLVPAAEEQAKAFYPLLRESSLGSVYRSDVEFAAQLEATIGAEERVLLPGRLAESRNEHWIFTTDAGRAVPLFSDVRTSFFLGLDGGSFTAGAYQAHVQPPNFDPVWLRSQNVLWLVESGNFPARILANHYERVMGNDHAVLWRLRPAGP